MAMATPTLQLPFLTRSEVRCGQVLGTGAFCKVSSVNSIVLKEILRTDEQAVSLHHEGQPSSSTSLSSSGRFLGRLTPDLASQEEARKRLASRDRSSFPPLAIKELKDSADSSISKSDLAVELDILRRIRMGGNHPHIIELFAVGVENFDEESVGPTFLILGRLRATLKNFIHSWRERRGVGLFQYLGLGAQQFRDLWLERLLVLSKIASAIEFLHSRKIIYRDLKPENVGFDADDVPKLFDFGLGKVVQGGSRDEANDTYELTGNAGSLRYMAPEVADEKPYGRSVDVYSLAILAYQVLSLKLPYCDVPPSRFRDQVFGRGMRPAIDLAWPRPLQNLLRRMWDENPRSRPASREVHCVVEDMLRGGDADLFPSDLVSGRWKG